MKNIIASRAYSRFPIVFDIGANDFYASIAFRIDDKFSTSEQLIIKKIISDFPKDSGLIRTDLFEVTKEHDDDKEANIIDIIKGTSLTDLENGLTTIINLRSAEQGQMHLTFNRYKVFLRGLDSKKSFNNANEEFRKTLRHELGHVFCLKHPYYNNDVTQEYFPLLDSSSMTDREIRTSFEESIMHASFPQFSKITSRYTAKDKEAMAEEFARKVEFTKKYHNNLLEAASAIDQENDPDGLLFPNCYDVLRLYEKLTEEAKKSIDAVKLEKCRTNLLKDIADKSGKSLREIEEKYEGAESIPRLYRELVIKPQHTIETFEKRLHSLPIPEKKQPRRAMIATCFLLKILQKRKKI